MSDARTARLIRVVLALANEQAHRLGRQPVKDLADLKPRKRREELFADAKAAIRAMEEGAS